MLISAATEMDAAASEDVEDARHTRRDEFAVHAGAEHRHVVVGLPATDGGCPHSLQAVARIERLADVVLLDLDPLDERLGDQVEQVVDKGRLVVHPREQAHLADHLAERVQRTLHVGEPDRKVAVRAGVVDRREHAGHPAVALGVGQAQPPGVCDRGDAGRADARVVAGALGDHDRAAEARCEHAGAEPGHEVRDDVVVDLGKVAREAALLVAHHAGRVGEVVVRLVAGGEREVARRVREDRHVVDGRDVGQREGPLDLLQATGEVKVAPRGGPDHQGLRVGRPVGPLVSRSGTGTLGRNEARHRVRGRRVKPAAVSRSGHAHPPEG